MTVQSIARRPSRCPGGGGSTRTWLSRGVGGWSARWPAPLAARGCRANRGRHSAAPSSPARSCPAPAPGPPTTARSRPTARWGRWSDRAGSGAVARHRGIGIGHRLGGGARLVAVVGAGFGRAQHQGAAVFGGEDDVVPLTRHLDGALQHGEHVLLDGHRRLGTRHPGRHHLADDERRARDLDRRRRTGCSRRCRPADHRRSGPWPTRLRASPSSEPAVRRATTRHGWSTSTAPDSFAEPVPSVVVGRSLTGSSDPQPAPRRIVATSATSKATAPDPVRSWRRAVGGRWSRRRRMSRLTMPRPRRFPASPTGADAASGGRPICPT